MIFDFCALDRKIAVSWLFRILWIQSQTEMQGRRHPDHHFLRGDLLGIEKYHSTWTMIYTDQVFK